MKNPTLLVVLFIILSFEFYSQDIPLEIPIEVDLGVNGLLLADTSNVKQLLGISDEIYKELLDAYFPPHLNIINQDSTELLVLMFHPGSYSYSFNEFNILELSDTFSEKCITLLKVERFITHKNVFLGMSNDELKSNLGNDFEKEMINGNTIVRYKLTEEYSDYNGKQFLNFYGMPIYYGHYTFIENKLRRIEFGFSYP